MNVPDFNSMLNARRSFKRESSPGQLQQHTTNSTAYLSPTESNQFQRNYSNSANMSGSEKVPQRSASIKRLPFSYIKTSTVQHQSSRSRENSSTNISDQARLAQLGQVLPKLCDDNYFLYANNDPNNAENVQHSSNNNLSPSQNTSNKFKNNYNFTRATLKTSSFSNYRRYSRYFDPSLTNTNFFYIIVFSKLPQIFKK
jgi:hypothetical protein